MKRHFEIRVVTPTGMTEFGMIAKDYDEAQEIADLAFPEAIDFEIKEVA